MVYCKFSNLGSRRQFFFNFLLVCPIWLPVFFLIFYNEPELGAEIDLGMALTPLPFSIGQGSSPQPSDCEPSALPLAAFAVEGNF